MNATDGKITSGRADHDQDTGDRSDAALAKSAQTSLGQPVDTALNKIPGTATSAELDDHPPPAPSGSSSRGSWTSSPRKPAPGHKDVMPAP
ncbi:hypothetical protein [Streptomyces sp. NPDC055692]|uniref:hypothetical protein n=1 Tax=Streptomyces sp. NPDC055692 TaxID=3155683 RepID=UPI00342D5306